MFEISNFGSLATAPAGALVLGGSAVLPAVFVVPAVFPAGAVWLQPMVRAITSTPQNFRHLLNIDGHSSTVWRTAFQELITLQADNCIRRSSGASVTSLHSGSMWLVH